MKGGAFGLARYGMLRGKTGKTFLVQFAKSENRQNFFCFASHFSIMNIIIELLQTDLGQFGNRCGHRFPL